MILVAGTLEALSAMAHKHLQLGVASPFLVSVCLTYRSVGTDAEPLVQYAPRPHTSLHLDTHRTQLRYVGSQIAEYGTPKSLGPIVFGVTG